MTGQVTLATSSGFPWLVLVLHVGTAAIALVAGFIAATVSKGGRWHRRNGIVFVAAMIATAISAAVVGAYQGEPTFIVAALVVYLVVTGLTTVRPLPGDSRRLNLALMSLAFTIGIVECAFGFHALSQPGNSLDGVPAGMMFFIGTVVLLAAIGDARMIRAGGIHGSRRVARHLWRMCFALFFASGSFFLGQMNLIPEPVRIVPLLIVLAVFPLIVLLYWIWRVRFRQSLRGLAIGMHFQSEIES